MNLLRGFDLLIFSLYFLIEKPSEDFQQLTLVSSHDKSCPLSFPVIDTEHASWQILSEEGNLVVNSLRLIPRPNATPIELERNFVRRCLRGRNIAFVGDSVSRYQYLNLVHFLAHGDWQSSYPMFENEKEWGSWLHFYAGTSARLVTHATRETCDCFREGFEIMIENRAFMDSENNFTISFSQFFDGYPSRGIDPELLTLNDCTVGVGCKQGGCMPGDCSRPTWIIQGGHVELLERIARTLNPDTIIFNSGIWPLSGFSSPGRIEDLRCLAVSLRSHGVRDLIWKTTTRINSNFADPGGNERNTLLPALAALGTSNQSSWRVFDAYALTASLARMGQPLSLFFLGPVPF